MIFYFTGTGNSLMAAKGVSEEGETLVNISEARKQGKLTYDLAGERLGFVFPVYCYTIGDAVLDFVRNAEFSNAGYTFAIVTCGGGIGGTDVFLKKELAKKGITLSYATSLLMPDNTVFYWDIEPDEDNQKRLAAATTLLTQIKTELAEQRQKPAKGLSTRFLRPFYHMMTGTKKFSVEESCIHCGLCAKNCPDEAIELKDGLPVWVKNKCTKCSACINRCPVRAIQYGSGTKKRRRYRNPALKG